MMIMLPLSYVLIYMKSTPCFKQYYNNIWRKDCRTESQRFKSQRFQSSMSVNVVLGSYLQGRVAMSQCLILSLFLPCFFVQYTQNMSSFIDCNFKSQNLKFENLLLSITEPIYLITTEPIIESSFELISMKIWIQILLKKVQIICSTRHMYSIYAQRRLFIIMIALKYVMLLLLIEKNLIFIIAILS